MSGNPQNFLKVLHKFTFRSHEIFSYVMRHLNLMIGIDQNEEIVSAEQVANVAKHIDRVRGIREMIGRNRMKVAFFGR